MFHHVSLGVADVERAARFYDPVMAALGFKRIVEYLPGAIGYGENEPSLWIGLPHNQLAATVGNGTHVGFSARTRDAVHRFYAAALANGGTDNGPPGPREMYGPDYYGAFVIDLDGNRLEATLHPAAAPRAKAAIRSKARAASRKATKKKSVGKRPAKKKAKRKAGRK
jgi:catechol 2,3-dioxygenase-like lactoylglutathione lyase family enzyme